MRHVLCFFITLCLTYALHAQSNDATTYRQGITVEVGGTALGYALSFERVLIARPGITWIGRGGVGVLPLHVYVPVATELHLLPGAHHLVLGGHATGHIQSFASFEFGQESSDTFLNLGAIVGYRWQAEESRFFAQVHLVPSAKLDPTPSQLNSTEVEWEFRVGAMVGVRL